MIADHRLPSPDHWSTVVDHQSTGQIMGQVRVGSGRATDRVATWTTQRVPRTT
nr:hypothetical protein [Tanacetum cinerariifolium]